MEILGLQPDRVGLRPGHQVQEHPYATGSHGINLLRNRGNGRRQNPEDRQVVESHNGEVAPDTDTDGLTGFDDLNGILRAPEDDRTDPLVSPLLQQLRVEGALLGRVSGNIAGGVLKAVRLIEQVVEDLFALAEGTGFLQGSRDHGNSSVSMPDQVLECLPEAWKGIGVDGGYWVTDRLSVAAGPVHVHDGKSPTSEFIQRLLGSWSGYDDGPVDVLAEEVAYLNPAFVGIALGRGANQGLEAVRQQFALYQIGQVGKVGVPDVGYQKADGA